MDKTKHIVSSLTTGPSQESPSISKAISLKATEEVLIQRNLHTSLTTNTNLETQSPDTGDKRYREGIGDNSITDKI